MSDHIKAIYFQLPEGEYVRLKVACAIHQIPMQKILRRALKLHLDELKEQRQKR